MSVDQDAAGEKREVGNTQDRPTEVFISYSSKDKDKVEALAYSLEKSGFAVWWDRALLPGDSYEGTIEVALKQARAVIVCWTQNAVASDWVRSEADDARLNGKLLPIFMEEITLPKPFDRIHTENLVGWRGNRDHHAYQELEEAIRARVEGRAAKTIPWRRKWITRGAVISFIAMAGVAAANVSLIKDVFFPTETLTASQVEQIVAAALANAGRQGMDLDDRGQENLRDALASVLQSADTDKAAAKESLMAGRVGEAADSLADVARRQAEAAGGAVTAAAKSYREAGALYSATNTDAAINAYRESLKLVPVSQNPQAANELAHMLERTGDIQEARSLYTQVLESNGKTSPLWKAKMLGNLGLMDEQSGDWAGAEARLLEAMEIFKTEGDELAVAKALINLGQIAQSDERWEEASNYTERGRALSKRINMPRGEATALANMGYQAMMLDDFAEARRYFSEAETLMQANNMKTELGLIYINLTRMLSIEGKQAEAEEMAQKALKVSQEMNVRMVEGGAYNHLGNLARDQGHYDEAELYQNKAIKIFADLEAPMKLEQQYRAFAMTAEARGDLDVAIERYTKALDVVKELDAPTAQASTQLEIARLYARTGEFEKSLELVEEASANSRKAGDARGIGEAFSMRAKISNAMGDPQSAVDAYASARDSYVEAGAPARAAEAMVMISDIAFQFGDSGVAQEALEDARELMPENAPLDLKSYAAISLAEARMMNGDQEGALAAAQANIDGLASAAKTRPELRADADLVMARLRRATGDEAAASKLFTRAASLMREAGDPFVQRADQIEEERDATPTP